MAVQVYNMSSSHSNQNLFSYIPSVGLLFCTDHFSSDLLYDLPYPDKGTLTLRKTIEQLGIEPKVFVGSHGARPLTMSDLRTVTDSYRSHDCPADISICEHP